MYWIFRFFLKNTIKKTNQISNNKEPSNIGDKIKFKFALEITPRIAIASAGG